MPKEQASVANIASAKKRARQAVRRRDHNASFKSRFR
ncbi:MAG: 30S ribosomal protein S20, partial [Pseudomonadales bacterium]|nr:30S ribosomal protein S20 [Pseudomonadales bacterium]